MNNSGRSGIYKIVNKTNGKCYVGSAVNIEQRWHGHKSDLKLKKHHSAHLQRAWEIYGADSFEFEVVEYVDKQLLIQREQYWIELLSAYGEHGYNTNPKAGSSLGVIRSSETRERIRLSKLGSVPWNKGKQTGAQPPELVERRIAHRRGVSRPDEVKMKISKTKRERGATPTPECLAKSMERRTRDAALRKLGLLPPLHDAERKKQVGAAISAAKKAAFAARKAAQLLNK
jgi:group I intron endonuclease